MEKRTVLFVDDEEKLLKSLKRRLMDEPYNTLFANSGKEALEVLKSNEVHVLVADIRMPDMSGSELLRIIKWEYPYIVRIVLSAHEHIGTLLNVINDVDVFKFFTKPCEFEEVLKPAIQEALDYYKSHSKSDTPVGKLE